jgi:hypothetical protein
MPLSQLSLRPSILANFSAFDKGFAFNVTRGPLLTGLILDTKEQILQAQLKRIEIQKRKYFRLVK